MLTSAHTIEDGPFDLLQSADAAGDDDYTALDDLLLSEGLVSEDVLELSRQVQRSTGIRLSSILVASHALSPEALAVVMGHPLRLPYIDLDNVPADDGAYELVPADFAASHDAVPFACNMVGRVLRVAFEQPTERAIATFESAFDVRVIAHSSERDKIKDYAFRLYNPLLVKRVVASRQHLYNQHMRIGAALAARGLVDLQTFGRAVAVQQSTGYRFGAVLAASGALADRAERELLAMPIPSPYVTLSHVRIDEEVKAMIDEEVAVEYRCAPLLHASGLLYTAFALTPTERVLRELDQISGACISPFVASRLEVLQFIGRLYPHATISFEAEIRRMLQSARATLPQAGGNAGTSGAGEQSDRHAPDTNGVNPGSDTGASVHSATQAAPTLQGHLSSKSTRGTEPKKRSTRRRYGHYR